ncbi:MAG: hypothetical protein D6733_01020 [Methanobacteriota archaeon]|nr:MAG: hypothetical protein D6733_01020 [Euryarchaeota archaeon]
MKDKARQRAKPAGSEPASKMAFLGLLLLIFGAGVYLFNYERQTVETGSLEPGQRLIEYHAPLWDPFPHHLRIRAEPSRAVSFAVAVGAGAASETESLFLSGGEKVLDIYPGERVIVTVADVNTAGGVVKTTLWCDSWNYAAALLAGTGAVLLVTDRRIRRRQKET